ncbi:MAG: hypothetical protein DI611_09110 [Brachybacterium faecium]|nr:MAG: hypothetical protein DI611_09110 [Brachybacterium faecium]
MWTSVSRRPVRNAAPHGQRPGAGEMRPGAGEMRPGAGEMRPGAGEMLESTAVVACWGDCSGAAPPLRRVTPRGRPVRGRDRGQAPPPPADSRPERSRRSLGSPV